MSEVIQVFLILTVKIRILLHKNLIYFNPDVKVVSRGLKQVKEDESRHQISSR